MQAKLDTGKRNFAMRLLAILLLLPGLAWAQPNCPSRFMDQQAESLECRCAPGAPDGPIWGSNPYTTDSGLCTAARHAGAIGAEGGTVQAKRAPGLASYPGRLQHGVVSADYGAWPQSMQIVLSAATQAPAGPQACPRNALELRGRVEPLICQCAAPGGGSVWGSDTYTADSDLCRAARHAGFIGPQGGPVTLNMGGALERFRGSRRNDVATSDFGAYGPSFTFQGPRLAGAEGPPSGVVPCGDTMQGEHGATEPVRCLCSAEAVGRAGNVWGSDAYTSDSATCRAALHAGAVRREGGEVVIRMLGGLPRYVGITRNGIATQNYGPWGHSFRFEGTSTGPQLCPDNMTAFAGGQEQLDCICTGEAVLRTGVIWGSGPYTADSATCRAARHAGVVPVTGGQVRVAMTGAAARWQASMSNGVQTRDFGQYPAGFRFEGAQNVAAGAPVQAPVADSLRRTGKVSLYINFRTGSADLDVAAAPVLTQLRDALREEPSLRLRILGHTDNQGTPAINGPLSQRRAAAVVAWLTQNGVAANRLVSEGRGPSQPIAENGSEAGRSLNRRVEAERTN